MKKNLSVRKLFVFAVNGVNRCVFFARVSLFFALACKGGATDITYTVNIVASPSLSPSFCDSGTLWIPVFYYGQIMGHPAWCNGQIVGQSSFSITDPCEYFGGTFQVEVQGAPPGTTISGYFVGGYPDCPNTIPTQQTITVYLGGGAGALTPPANTKPDDLKRGGNECQESIGGAAAQPPMAL